MDELNIKRHVEVARYPRRYEVDRTPMIRLYKSGPSSATLQLRSGTTYATAQYLDVSEMRELISKLRAIVEAIEPSQKLHFNMFARKEPWFWPVEDADERGSEG
jgi:hypothetical protein